MFLLSQEGQAASVVVIVPCLWMIRCREFWIIIVEDGTMYRSGTDVNDNDENVGCEWKMATFFRSCHLVMYHTLIEVSCQDTFISLPMLALQILYDIF